MQLKEATNYVKLHEIKCYNIQARGIKSLSYSKSSERLGVVRNDYSMEIWNMSCAPFLERMIPGRVESSVEAICWVGERLFSIGLAGSGIKEWDLTTLTTKRKLMLIGESGICIDHHEEKIAVGTEEGIINIFTTSYDDLQFCKLLDRQDHRIICCKFDDTGEKLVSGGIDSVKVWSLQTGQVIHKMSTGRSESCQPTIVWCLDILNDFTIVSGDSRGKITFWDGIVGAQTDYVHPSNFDIMCIAVSEDRKSFFCSGIEQIIRRFSQVVSTKSETGVHQWVRSMKRSKLHTHDVMTMTSIGENLIASGGIDGFLTMSTHDLKHFQRFGPFLQQPMATVAQECRLILMKYVNYVELWRLADPGKVHLKNDIAQELEETADKNQPAIFISSQSAQETYDMSKPPEKLVELHSKGNETITCCAITNDGNWLAYSTESVFRLFCLKLQENEKPILQLIKSVSQDCLPCIRMLFSNDSKSLFCFRNDMTFSTYKVYSDGLDHKETVDISDHHSDLVHLIDLSKCSSFLAMASLCKKVTFWAFQRNKWNLIKTLPKYGYPATSLRIDTNQNKLAVAYSDNRFLELNLDNQMMEYSTKLSTVNKVSSGVKMPVLDLTFDPRNDNIILYREDDSIKIIKKNIDKSNKKKAKHENKSDNQLEVNTIKKYDEFLLHLEFLGNEELVTIEINPVVLTENLPMPLRKKQFGAT